MTFKIVDRAHFNFCAKLKIKSAFKMMDNVWVSQTDNESVLIKIVDDVLTVGANEIDYNVGDSMRMVGVILADSPMKKEKITFSDIALFFRWELDKDYCQD